MKSRMFALFIALLISVSVSMAQSGTTKNGQGPAEGAKQASAQPSVKTSDTKQEDCGCEASNTPTDTVGVVNAVKITFKDLDEPMKDEIAALRKQVIEARRRELNLQINSRLLEAEARRQGTTSTKLVEQEIVAKAKEPTEAEVQAFYDQNKERIPGEFKEYKAQIVDYLKAQRQEEAAKKFAEKLRAGAEVKVLDEKVTAPEKPEDRARVFALLNGSKITSGDIEEALQPLIYDVQRKLYELRKGELELRINDVLLEQEAQKRKITTQAVVEAELTPKVKKVSEDDARKFYAEQKDRIDGSFDQVKDRLIDYLQKREQRRAELAFVEEMKKGAKVEMSLKEPVSPSYKIATDDQPSKGSADAPVTIVEFTDFECSTCQQSQPMLDKVAQEYSDKVRLVVRDYPLAQHKNAFKAAEAAEAAREQGKYWEYTAVLFANQKELGPEKLKEYASKVGLDRKKFDAELDSSKHANKVQRDMQDGMRVGVDGTPAVFINGRRVSDRTYESLKAAIEEALKAAAKKKGNGL